mmetsp:Transcript_14882/g.42202  ORF Transcript_14882/g.42202 Transcript_14882/m.42202 type:complete len:239 (-) Transcript_14882:105-821(-)
MRTSPGCIAATMAFTSSVALQSGAQAIFFPISSPMRAATGFNENFSSGPFLGLPRWEHAMTLAPCAHKCSIVGMEEVIRVSSVIWRSEFRGTFRSQRTKTRLPRRSSSDRSSTDFFARVLVTGARAGGNADQPVTGFRDRACTFCNSLARRPAPTMRPTAAKLAAAQAATMAIPGPVLLCAYSMAPSTGWTSTSTFAVGTSQLADCARGARTAGTAKTVLKPNGSRCKSRSPPKASTA